MVQEKKQTGIRRSATRGVRSEEAPAPVHTPSAAPPKRRRARVIAEARGLAQRDAVVSAHPGAARHSVIDQNFKLWLALVRLSPISFVLHQQAVIAQIVLGFMPASKPVR